MKAWLWADKQELKPELSRMLRRGEEKRGEERREGGDGRGEEKRWRQKRGEEGRLEERRGEERRAAAAVMCSGGNESQEMASPYS